MSCLSSGPLTLCTAHSFSIDPPKSCHSPTHSHPPSKTTGLTEAEKSIMKKYESKFVTLEPAPEYTIDRINNGLYR